MPTWSLALAVMHRPPVYATAHKMDIPIAIHEQNARAGMANKLGARWADFIGTVYDETGLKPRKGAALERVGLPLRPAIAALSQRLEVDREGVRKESAAELGIDPNRPVVVVYRRFPGRAEPESSHCLVRPLICWPMLRSFI